MQQARHRPGAGFTVFELVVVVAIIGVLASIAIPGMRATIDNQRLKDQSLQVAAALNRARSEAIRTGNNFIVFYGTDATGSTLADGGGDPVPLLVLDDGRRGTIDSNCLIDGGEPFSVVEAELGIGAGVTGSPARAPSDLGAGDISTGSSFRDPSANAARWVLFRPDGAPLSFDSSCTLGVLGSGSGAFYLRNGNRSAAVTLSPTGITRVHVYGESWSQ